MTEQNPKNEKDEVTCWSLFNAQVCSKGTWDEALDFIRAEMPAGTSGNWFKSESPNHAPVKCHDHSDRQHFMFVC